MKIPFLVGWTSINPSYFDVNYRDSMGVDTAKMSQLLLHNSSSQSSHTSPGKHIMVQANVLTALKNVLGEFIHVYIIYIYMCIYICIYRAEAGVPRKAIMKFIVFQFEKCHLSLCFTVFCILPIMWEYRELVQHADNISVICCPLFQCCFVFFKFIN